MGRREMQVLECKRDGSLSISHWGNLQDSNFIPGGLFASVGQMGFGVSSPNPSDSRDENGGFKIPYFDLYMKYLSFPDGFKILGNGEEQGIVKKEKKKGGLKIKLKVSNPSLRRLISGAIAGAVSRTAVAPLETIRTHLMVGSSGHSSTEVFNNIMKTEGWIGLFRGNFVNVIRVAPSKAVELFAYDTVNKNLSSKPGEQPKIPIPASLVAGACAGVSSTLLTYPLELVKTRLTIQRGVYDGLFDAFVKILKEGGPGELYRGLTPSLIGVIPYAATNYFAYDTLRKAYRKIFKEEKIGNIETLLIGSAAGAISSTATFPLEVARKHMQVGAVSGRIVYKNVIHALASILEQEGIQGLYKGLGPSCMKLVPAAGISFMCYEACKRILIEAENEE
ncbi:Adenine nucleotide transporter BT1, chloroplastic/mitochondrial [Capsicum baccatum]|uniref:Adenine nucleotide transporter BT1, chloroplastic/mitochondrial n=2 Tax=Capsicum TaxID=4071 RepID=A0A1U8DTV1_CAPAN|nr:adenine nucleotide transporter BT1, chloroplastic/mitochondrial [Capsicum annuum]KAF3665588.1 Adenine nucleotide transporter BT1, chloroplastic/mitochondrial [Capsicum annuum]PHT40342.1 Adenine nucleotide transporter BT1, chloroplastic/mitochondrial [Capsicum baccatum]PHT73991.1 Adenine nucleotide transporter BT1, chloroplastic/mitochondrial [Capsicum annuum]PHU22756.1 Adenine nucleotide transporter BT1, chloroplastic/mitochondrial [Capsicum chinense]